MDESKNIELDKYLSNLPSNIIDVAQDKIWPKRVDEIAIKYSLTEEQSIDLQDIILLIIIGVETPETFAQSVEQELNISKLLTEQIVKDIDVRVFQYIFNIISENKTAVTEKVQTLTSEVEEIEKTVITPKTETKTDFDVVRSMSKDTDYLKEGKDLVMHRPINKQVEPQEIKEIETVTPKTPTDLAKQSNYDAFWQTTKPSNEQSEIPEIRPEILPMVERPTIEAGMALPTNPKIPQAPDNLPGVEIKSSQDLLGEEQKTFVGSEFIQRPISVPRYTNEPVPEVQNTTIPVPPAPQTTVQSIDQKQTNSTPEKPKTENPPAPTKYTSDPYREPLS